ncbi:FdhD protein [Rhodovulum bhavnagarense]|uniref:Sulfur carrier protein FdhD n=2 Tax=Rhodovulum bhavnagarense TaxID=992286 RepID=A0A4R2RQ52_9RHOB|nr:FdhD protein [Rhodovulum bhavnagarense]
MRPADRVLARECAVALSFDGATQAVMMASPVALEDFALGFALSEEIVASPDQITAIERVEHNTGIEMRMWLAAPVGARLAARRRAMVGPVGCGLCGLDSLAAAERPLPPLPACGLRVTRAEIVRAMSDMRAVQTLHSQTGGTHAAGFWTPGKGLGTLREDIGRHIALDKLIGARARAGADLSGGIVVMSSRLSIELVQKAVLARAPILAAVSAPTARAVATADAAGLTLVAWARGERCEVYTHPHRIAGTTGGRDAV